MWWLAWCAGMVEVGVEEGKQVGKELEILMQLGFHGLRLGFSQSWQEVGR